YLFGITQSGKVESVTPKDSHGRERLILFLPVAEIRIRNRAILEIRLALAEGDEFFRMRVGKRVQQHAVDHRKNSSVRTDSQRQRENGHNRKSRGPAQHAGPVASVLKDGLKKVHPARFATLFLHAFHASELDLREASRLVRAHTAADV